jgi:hypothetical protein
MKTGIRYGIILCILLIALAFSVPQATGADDIPDALAIDAEVYARYNKVSVNEALERLKFQQAAGELNARLVSQESDTFAGLWIQHAPDFRIVVQFTGDGEAALRPYLTKNIAGVIDLRSAKISLKQLEIDQEVSLTALKEAGIHADTSINISKNRIDINMPDVVLATSTLKSNLKLPADAVLLPVKSLAQPTVDLYGGISLDGLAGGATAGFPVQDSKGRRGITTCAHTDYVLFYLRYGVPFWLPCQQSRKDTYFDIQWHSSGTFNVVNEINTGMSERRKITGEVKRESQALGSFVAKYGKTTGYTAGYIDSNSITLDYIPDCKPTFFKVNHAPAEDTICDVGDSGGPWFLGNDAYGTTCAKDSGGDGYYMAIDYLSGVGVSLLTEP